MLTPDGVVALYGERSKHYAELHSVMVEVKNIYDGKVTIDLPEMDKNPHVGVPNLLAQGIDQYGSRIAGIIPQVRFSAHDNNSRPAVRRAMTASRVVSAWWEADRFKPKQAQRARHFVAYGISPVVIRWDNERHIPVREIRNPLETYPSPETINGTTVPTDCLFAFKRSIGWLKRQGWGNQVNVVLGGNNQVHDDRMLLCLEYIDPDGRMLVVTGQTSGTTYIDMPNAYGPPGINKAALLEFAPMKEQYCCVTIPSRLTLDRPTGQFDTMMGMYYTSARLLALETIAVERGIFPDTYLESRPNEVGRVVAGPFDGRTGEINIVAGGAIKEIQSAPSYVATQIVDRLERAQRLSSGIPADFGGESATNVRTARRGDSILSTMIDYPIAEAQDAFQYALEDENRISIALAKMYDGSAKRTLYVGTGNEIRSVTYVADEVFPTSEHRVTYPVSGADVNTMMIGMEQRVGAGGMSKQTMMRLDPWVADAEAEHDRIIFEGLEQAAMAQLQQAAAAPPGQPGAMPLVSILKIASLVQSDSMELLEAMVKVAEDGQQAAQDQGQPSALPPGQGAPPDAQAAAGPQAAQALTGAPAVPGEGQGQQDLAQLFQQLRTPGKIEQRSGQSA